MSASDRATNMVVGIMTVDPRYDEDLDHEGYVEACLPPDATPEELSRPRAVILVLDSRCPPPSAKWRKKIADLRNDQPYAHYGFALITKSAVLRGVLTAINWISRASPRFDTAPFATFDEGAMWLERHWKHSAPVLNKLYQKARSQLSPSALANL